MSTAPLPALNADAVGWHTLCGPLIPAAIERIATETAVQHALTTEAFGSGLRLVRTTGGEAVVTVRWQPAPPQPPRTLGHQLAPAPFTEVLIAPTGRDVAEELRQRLTAACEAHTDDELATIRAAMPLLQRHSSPTAAFDGWALIFRDHYLEHSLGFLLAVERAGIPPRWIAALDKGDRTAGRDRIRATFAARGYRTGLLDNTAINAPAAHAAALERATAEVDAFIDAARAAGRRILVIDDGGLLARGYGTAGAPRTVDAALELTVSGIQRIAAAGPLAIPVLNLARSQLKTRLGYPEIADSCLRRLRAILPDRKFIGRPALLLGYGTLGSQLASAFRALGCPLHVVDTDVMALIDAAEHGYATHRTARDALAAVRPWLVIGTTGEDALREDDLPLLPDGVHLAPFATRDFSLLGRSPFRRNAVEIPGVGTRFRLPSGRTLVLLGDGRSLNLFEADSIGPEGYDAYRAGTLIAAAYLCADPGRVPPGLHTAPADHAIADAGLWDAYYDHHLAPRERQLGTACVIGYGVAGRLHTDILADLASDVIVVDPKHQDLPRERRAFRQDVGDLAPAVAAGVDLWSICAPTADHLPILRAILAHDPAARILVEKPLCLAHEIDAFAELAASHPEARIVVGDQYRHAAALPAFTRLVQRLEPATALSRVAVSFTKDRGADIAGGRFIDADYGVLGYEWLHMLTVLAGILPAPIMSTYLDSNPATSQLTATYDPRLFVSALTEHTTLHRPQSAPLHLELSSSILAPAALLGPPPQPAAPWRRNIRPTDTRHRHLTADAGNTRFTLHLDPVTTADGWQLDRNHHRLTATRLDNGQLLHDEVIHDSPLTTSLHHAVTTLLATTPPPPPVLTSLRRIATLATLLHAHTPPNAADNADYPQPRPATPSR
ncbi:hypothetical protein [Streptomyces sp. PT12]|uniref:hypothetical protein n=1 Tax=Streptomyces sp. PT12 TaxID=1510197 RepID=UPI0015EF3BC5|nr:hypothetical protein [Streptomyces sp. PT12]